MSRLTTLSDLGITRDQSSKWQQLAKIPADQFEKLLGEQRPTTEGILRGFRAGAGERTGNSPEQGSVALLELDGYRCTNAGASLAPWSIIGIGPYDVVLCQVRKGDWPKAAEMEALRSTPVPLNCRKLVHSWHNAGGPDIAEVTA